MHNRLTSSPWIAIACGGTGGHLFPGIAVAEQLLRRGCGVSLLISPKEVDLQCVKQLKDDSGGVDRLEIFTLPAVGLVRGGELAFVRAFCRSLRNARKLFKIRRPNVVLGMGGFTSAAPLLAGKMMRAKAFLHESNAIPGRANRWLSRVVDCAFVAFPGAATCLKHRRVTVSGTPVRRQFQPRNAVSCRTALGLDSSRPVVLVMGGSQGATGVNRMVIDALPLLARLNPNWQWLHLTGTGEADAARKAYAAAKVDGMVHPFFNEMELALGAATVAITRAGGSSLAELAAVRLPSILVPYPAATDNHQYFNAKAFNDSGAAYLLNQNDGAPHTLANLLLDLMDNAVVRQKMLNALDLWDKPRAAEQIAESLLAGCRVSSAQPVGRDIPRPSTLDARHPTRITA